MEALRREIAVLEATLARLAASTAPQAAEEIARLTARLERMRAALESAGVALPSTSPSDPVSRSAGEKGPTPEKGEEGGILGSRSGPLKVELVGPVPVKVQIDGQSGQPGEPGKRGVSRSESSTVLSTDLSNHSESNTAQTSPVTVTTPVVVTPGTTPLDVRTEASANAQGGHAGEGGQPGPAGAGGSSRSDATATAQAQAVPGQPGQAGAPAVVPVAIAAVGEPVPVRIEPSAGQSADQGKHGPGVPPGPAGATAISTSSAQGGVGTGGAPGSPGVPAGGAGPLHVAIEAPLPVPVISTSGQPGQSGQAGIPGTGGTGGPAGTPATASAQVTAQGQSVSPTTVSAPHVPVITPATQTRERLTSLNREVRSSEATATHQATRQGQTGLAGEVRLESRQSVSDLQRTVQLEQQRTRYMESGAGLAMLEREVRMRTELASIQARQESSRQNATASHYESTAGKSELRSQVSSQSSTDTAKIQQTVALERQRLQVVSSPQGKAAIQEQVRLQKEFASAQASVSYQRIAAEQGTFVAGLSMLDGKLATAQHQMAGLSNAAQSVWSQGTSSIMSLVAAADPFSTWPTYQASVEGLAISVGTIFLPYVDKLSLGIQNATKWFDGLSDGTKQWIAYGALAAVSMAGVAVAISKVIAMARTLIAVGQTSIFLMTNPWTAAIAGALALAAGVGYLAYQWSQAGNAAKGARGDMEGAGDVDPGKGPRKPVDEKIARADLALLRAAREDFFKRLNDLKDQPEKMAAEVQKIERETLIAKEIASKKELGGSGPRTEFETKFAERISPILKGRERIEAVIPDDGHKPLTAKEIADQKVYIQGIVAEVLPGREKLAEGTKAERDKYALQLLKIEALRAMATAGTYTPERGEALAKHFEEQGPKLLGKMDREKGISGLGAGVFGAPAVNKAEAELKIVQEIMKNFSIPTLGMSGKGEEGPDRALRGLPQPAILDNQAYADRLTVAAIKGDDLDAKHRERQLENALKTITQLETLNNTMDRVERILDRPPIYRTPSGSR